MLPAQLPNTAKSGPPPVLLPYQKAWIADDSPLKVSEKSRRTGLTWAEASDDVLSASAEDGQNVYYIGYNQDMAIEYIEACAMWARAFNYAASEIEEGIWVDDDPDKHIKTYTIRFPSKRRIVALSSRPANLRGKQGIVVIDEAAFHEKLSELLKAAIALLIWGGKVRVISTHDGDTNPFNELISEIRAGKRKGSVHRIEFREAVEQGLYRRVCLRLGKEWTVQGEREWVRSVYDFYGDDATEELDVVPSQGSGAFLARALIERCMDEKLPVLLLALPDEFVHLLAHIREAETKDWCEEHLLPRLQSLNPNLRHYVGEDFGRSGDLSVQFPLLEEPGLTLRAPFVLELRNVPFDQQRQIFFYLCDRLPRFSGGALDGRGNGQYLAEVAQQRYGAQRIEIVMLTTEWYRQHMPPFKALFEDGTIAIPKDADILGDLRAIKVDRGIAKVPDNARSKGADGRPRHGDSAIAAALAKYAVDNLSAPAIEWTVAPEKHQRWDAGRGDSDDDDLGVQPAGAW